MDLASLLRSYGYLAVFLGTALEGETILILAGFAAHRGYLQLPWVILFAFLGSFAGDQTFFVIGRRKGRPLVERRPLWNARIQRAEELLQRYQLGFRFLYGLRNVIPFSIGLSQISFRKFFLLNAADALLWATVVGSAGYLFGSALEIFLGDLERHELKIALSICVMGIIIWLIRYFRAKSRRQNRQFQS
jgi:membrane protein DedA with SNARE-associated domain